MSKELSPLEALDKISLQLEIALTLFEDIFASCPEQIKETINGLKKAIKLLPTIETALKDYEKQYQIDTVLLGTAYKTIVQNQKKLKALEIIKSFVYFDIIEVQGQWFLIQGISFDKSLKLPITKEQAKLLKEVLL